MIPRLLLPLLLLPLAALADEAAPPEPAIEPAAEAKPAIERLPDGRLKLDEIIFDARSREIRFPAEVNMTDGLLEFLIVHRNGKIHESLLLTEISPARLNVVLQLLHYQASRELYFKILPDGSMSTEFETATPEQRAASRLRLGVEWKVGDETKSANLNEWISHAVTEKPMPADPWIYGGSFVHEGRFVAEGSGDIAAIFLSNAAMMNFAGKDNQDDDVWLPFPKRVPPVGTKVTVVIAPFDNPPSP